MPALLRIACALTALALLLPGCGDDGEEGSDRSDEATRADRPARPPGGWRTVRNAAAGFTVSAPKRWTTATKRGATLIRSDDRLVSITISGDRSKKGRQLAPAHYARRTIDSLPGFDGTVQARVRRVRGSRYASARVEGSGRLTTSPRRQRITVAVYRVLGTATYSAIVFRNAAVKPHFNDRRVNRLLRSFRAGRRSR